MGLLGLSLIVASVVYVIIRPPSWLPRTLLSWLQRSTAATITDGPRRDEKDRPGKGVPPPAPPTVTAPDEVTDRAAMPPPPAPRVAAPTIAVEQDQQPDSPTTPKASASQPPSSMPPPPSFSLSTESMPPPPRPSAAKSSSSSASSMMPPPPPPSRLAGARPPTLGQFPAPNSVQRARGPVPNRGPPSSLAPPSSSGGLAPPPSHNSIPTKPSRQVTLDPGHSPLDWARISGPNSDLRGVPASTPYLRVTPSMLKRQTGRKGKDAWMALNGKVYNVTPYAKFHPGGVPELMRGAGRDGTRLFGEVHPWVNYENMLTACLVGLLVDEPEAGAGQESEMDAMD